MWSLGCRLALNAAVTFLFLAFGRCSILPPYEIAAKTFEEYPLPELQYGFNELEPFIDENTVHAHYEGHHETYRKKMNSFLQQWRSESNVTELPQQDLFTILASLDEVPATVKEGIQNNVGGFVNHALYWSILAPNPNKVVRRPTSNLLAALEKNFGSYEQFQSIFTSKALSLFGSGYVWLVCEDTTSPDVRLLILSYANQDCPISQNLYPLLVIDIWEHAYYLKHQFRRNDYISDFWSLVEWQNVEKLWQFWKSRDKFPTENREEL